MTCRFVNRWLFLAAIASVAMFAQGAPSATRPNIVFILADDLGWGDLGCYGHPYSKTPNLDNLAKEGTRFTQFYVTGVTCCPSRTGFMTGKFPATYKTYPALGGFGERQTITDLLKREGYRTGHFGKWHIGPNETAGTYGIDVVRTSDENPSAPQRGKTPRGRDSQIFDEAIQFIETSKDGPFYVNVWAHISHFPVNPPAAYAARFKDITVKESDFSATMQAKFYLLKSQGADLNQSMRNYLGDVNSLDEDIGRLLKRLNELGLRDNTIVVFSSDQGPADSSRLSDEEAKNTNSKRSKDKRRKREDSASKEQLRLNAVGYAGPFRGGKHLQYDGGVRSPFIIRWPGRVPANRADDKSVISGIDWLPTLGAIAGVKTLPSQLDGEDVRNAWFGKEFTRSLPLMWKTSTANSAPAIRDGVWKLHMSRRNRGGNELYNLAVDPSESKNVAMENPKVVEELTAKLKRWTATLPADYEKVRDPDN